MNFLKLITFVGFIAFVAIYAYMKTRKDDKSTKAGYFLGGRSLTAVVIASSLMLTNLSTEQLIGESGFAFRSGMIVIAFETICAVTLTLMANFFLPRYLQRGITTISDFIEERYDLTTRTMIDFCFLMATGVCFLPVVLYSGALGFNGLFDISGMLGVTKSQAIILTIVALGLAGCCYVVLGGLKLSAVSDSINGIGLVVGGLAVTICGLTYLGHGSIFSGLSELANKFPERLNPIGSAHSPIPFGAVISGLIIVSTFYWCTNQGIIQRTLGAKNLVEGQKGVLLTGFLKLMDPIILVLPGVIAFHIFPTLKNGDLAYTMLVDKVLPPYLSGLFGAVLFGAILSSFNGFLNSASTLFSIGVWGRHVERDASGKKLVKVGRYCTFILAIGSVIIAPFIANAPHGLFQWLQSLNGVYNGPLVTVIIMGFLFKKIPAIAAKFAIIFGVITYILIVYVFKLHINFLFAVLIVFIINATVMLILSKVKPREVPFVFKDSKEVDITKWVGAKTASISLISALVAIYSFFATFGGYHTMIISILGFISFIVFGVITLLKRQPKIDEL